MTERPSIPAAYRVHPEPRPRVNGALSWGVALLCFGWLTVAAIAIALIVWGGK